MITISSVTFDSLAFVLGGLTASAANLVAETARSMGTVTLIAGEDKYVRVVANGDHFDVTPDSLNESDWFIIA